jgi:hypothetical protein
MVENIANVLESSTPSVRARYLERIMLVPGPEARELEYKIRSMVERDRTSRAA